MPTEAPAPTTIEGLHTRITDALTSAAYECDGACGLGERECYDAHPINFSARCNGVTHIDGAATAVADLVIEVLRGEQHAAQADWEEHGYSLRDCVIPGCLRQFDVVASWTSEGRAQVKESLRSDGWLQQPRISGLGYMCPDHVPALWAERQHLPHWDHGQPDDLPRRSVLRCSCGWEARQVRFTGVATALWQEHALEVLEAGR